eukprot:m.25933 g.25933  ORF g.25933 m.25933 type:complete len:356 (-) comp9216_c0_seq1:135-1202(-)
MEVVDHCSLLLCVYDRHKEFLQRLSFYDSALVLHDIHVVWNAVDETPPIIHPHDYYLPVHMHVQWKNSINNRFVPRENMQDCVINMDDDWNMPHQVMYATARLWRFLDGGKMNRIAGVLHNARSFARMMSTQRPIYLRNDNMPLSIVLPSGMVYHKSYMYMYTHQLSPALRKVVDVTMNCDDILFNFMVANATGKPPIFVDTQTERGVHVINSLGLKRGLWTQGYHFVKRSRCLEVFEREFGKDTLQFTRTSFLINDHLGDSFPTAQHPNPIENTHCVVCNEAKELEQEKKYLQHLQRINRGDIGEEDDKEGEEDGKEKKVPEYTQEEDSTFNGVKKHQGLGQACVRCTYSVVEQ